MLLSISWSAFGRESSERIADRKMSNVIQCTLGTQGAANLPNALLTITYRTKSLILTVQDIDSVKNYGRALFVDSPIEGAFVTDAEDKETLRFVSNGSK